MSMYLSAADCFRLRAWQRAARLHCPEQSNFERFGDGSTFKIVTRSISGLIRDSYHASDHTRRKGRSRRSLAICRAGGVVFCASAFRGHHRRPLANARPSWSRRSGRETVTRGAGCGQNMHALHNSTGVVPQLWKLSVPRSRLLRLEITRLLYANACYNTRAR